MSSRPLQPPAPDEQWRLEIEQAVERLLELADSLRELPLEGLAPLFGPPARE